MQRLGSKACGTRSCIVYVNFGAYPPLSLENVRSWRNCAESLLDLFYAVFVRFESWCGDWYLIFRKAHYCPVSVMHCGDIAGANTEKGMTRESRYVKEMAGKVTHRKFYAEQGEKELANAISGRAHEHVGKELACRAPRSLQHRHPTPEVAYIRAGEDRCPPTANLRGELTGGKQRRSFGRVLYVEAESLVFYAYDFDDHKQFKSNVVFYVWGGKTGVKEVTHNLGILRKDDDGQSRWAMTFDDSKVLSEINSVFVTAEAPSKHYDQPRGRKVLYAYFGGQPNHP
jgi:hypothetical protein